MVRVRPVGDDIGDYARPALRALASTVGFVLLLACVSLAGLLVARGTARGYEMAVRAALGAGRWRLVRQMLTESVLLALCGGTLGLLIAHWGLAAVVAVAPPHLGLDGALRLDGVVLAYTAAISAVTGLVFGLVPAVYGSSPRLAGTLQGSRTTTGPRRGRRLLALLVITEIALAGVLLTGGGLMLESFVGLLRVDTGIRTDHLLTFEIALPRATYNTAPAITGLYASMLERLRSTPGVLGAALVNPLPMSRQYSGSGFQIDSRPRVEVGGGVHAQWLAASAGYFATAGIPVVAGREFTDTDKTGAPHVVIVNQAFARLFLAHEDPFAHTVNGARIVGVVGDIRHNGPAMPTNAQIYTALAQQPSPLVGVVVRTSADPLAMMRSVRAALLATDPALPWDRVKTMEQVVSESIAEPRMASALVFGFALFAVLLAGIGVYGVVAFSVGQRAHEIGVRVALGASPGGVVRLVLAQGVRLAAAGGAVGVPAAIATSRLLTSLLVGVSPRDPAVLLVVPVILLMVTLAASYLPARRAMRVNPLDVLRAE
jgi:putative ABC transport system permease protein